MIGAGVVLRKFVGNIIFIHFLVFLGLLALWGFIATENKYFILLVVLSLSGAVCGGFVRTIDAIRKK